MGRSFGVKALIFWDRFFQLRLSKEASTIGWGLLILYPTYLFSCFASEINCPPQEGLIELIKREKGYLRKAAEDVIARLPAEVEIYYNPKDPEESVIYAHAAWMGAVLILFVFARLVRVAQFLS